MAVVTPTAKSQFIDANGQPLVGGKLYSYIAGTTLPQATYTDNTGAVANTNPVILDSRGEASIWLGEATYKFKLTDADDVEIWTVDYIAAPTTSLSPILSGNVTISTNSSGPALKITQTGTGPVLRVQDEVDPDITPFIINSAGLVGLGTVAPAEALDIDNQGKIQLSDAGIPRTLISQDASNSIFTAEGVRNFVIKTDGATRLTIDGAGDATFAQDVTVVGSVTAATFYGPWENLPAGTAMLFVQTTAPTGWTKSTTHDNKALRVVSGAASSGGSVAFTTAFASQAVTGTVASYTLTTSDIPSHSHSASSFSTSNSSSSSSVSDPGHAHSYTAGGSAGFAYQAGFSAANSSNPFAATTGGSGTGISVSTLTSTNTSTTTSIGNTGGGGGHAHGFSAPNINLAVQYVDVIIAVKN